MARTLRTRYDSLRDCDQLDIITNITLQANNLNQSLFDSDWTEMPVSHREMMITLMTFGHKKLRIKIPPFYVVCRPALGEVHNRFLLLEKS